MAKEKVVYKVLETSYIGMRTYEPGEYVAFDPDTETGSNLKKATPAEIAKHQAAIEEAKGDPDLVTA